ESILLEIVWTVIPTAIVLAMFYLGWADFDYIRRPPDDAMTIEVAARQWSWTFKYDNGKTTEDLRVPIGQPVKLILSSEDVIHGFYIPAYRIKEDAVPGLKTYLWFIAKEEGAYDIFCSEYCGTGHSRMLSRLVAMKRQDFDQWYRKVAADASGLLVAKGCSGCHSLDGTRKVGPTLKGVYGSKVTVVTGGIERTIVADEEYLTRSILHPEADIVKGYPPLMPVIPLSPEELNSIVEYLKALK
ncbi:MAG: cytochrome c oxidase subunit II, partial [Thermodesulfovibrionales bacterium]